VLGFYDLLRRTRLAGLFRYNGGMKNAVAIILLSAVSVSAADRSPLIAAAASLSDVLPKVAAAYEKSGGAHIEFTFDASSRLARQIEEHAPVDGFVSADEEWMGALQKKGRIDATTRTDLLTNRLVAVTPSSTSVKIGDAAGLAAAGIKHLALAGETVPAGKYAKAALESAGVWKAVETKVVRADNVRGALRWVAAGEAEAGIVYATDAAAEPRVKTAFIFPESSHPPIVYPAAAVAGAQKAPAAAAFLAFCRGIEAGRLFREAGFGLASAKTEPKTK
jgi:molybdate transport system substrate-binding protein